MILFEQLFWTFLSTLRDVAPILLVIGFFQAFVLRQRISNWRQVAIGIGCVILGLTAFLVGLELALFPLGNAMAEQLADPRFVLGPDAKDTFETAVPWYRFYWTYIFAFAIGFSATIAEPALLAVAIKAHEVSGGTLKVWPLRAVVALGAGIGVTLGAYRIVTGIPLTYFIFSGYILIIIQTLFAPKQIIPLAYDSGGVTTSTITVPLVAAMGLGLATQIPGRSPLAEGFGMIALTVLFPMMTVMGYAQVAAWWQARTRSEKVDLES
jgi:hypothetical protein